ncbi:MAG: hypothetical protein AAGC73_07330 [Verrucomicrobiota bacterium]
MATTKTTKVPNSRYKAVRFHTDDTMDSIKASILNHMRFTLARHPEGATKDEWWTATSLACVTVCWIVS